MKKFNKPYGITKAPIKKALKWKLGSLFKKRRERVADDDFRLNIQPLSAKDLVSDDDFIVWLGHATFYMQLDGVKIITDPVFGGIPLIPRLAELPIDPKLLEPDIVLLSHGHYDHLDLKSLDVLDIYGKGVKVVMPLGLGSYLKDGVSGVELDWYGTTTHNGVTIEALPASHWHRRGVFDFNRALWCSFSISSSKRRLFFAGDTAMDGHFKEIKQKCAPIDTALLPIGAYQPREIMKDNHLNPQEALDAAEILGAKEMLPYHYGTFKLSDEPIGEPYSWIKRLAASSSKVDIKVVDVGEVYKLKRGKE